MDIKFKEVIFFLVAIILIVSVFIGDATLDDELAAKTFILSKETANQGVNSAGKASLISKLEWMNCTENIDDSISVTFEKSQQSLTRIYHDSCDDTKVMHFYCNKERPALLRVQCDFDCSNGECVKYEDTTDLNSNE